MKYYIDSVKRQGGKTVVLGWAAGSHPDSPVKIEVRNKKGESIKADRTDAARYDVNKAIFQGKSKRKLGFCLSFVSSEAEVYDIVFQCEGKTIREKLEPVGERETLVKKSLHVLKEEGGRAFLKRAWKKVRNKRNVYQKWRLQTMPDSRELERQRTSRFPYMPVFSIVVPLYHTPEKFLREMILSVQKQTYGNWELCLADGSTPEGCLEKLVSEYQKEDSRIKYSNLKGNRGISGNTNAALLMAAGDYIVLLDHDDILEVNALYECANRINKEREKGGHVQVLYSDEDKLDQKRGRNVYLMPHFKPDFNPDLLRSVNYISHLFVVERKLAEKVGGFLPEFDGAQDYDFIFRCTEQAEGIVHIPKVLYHWRINAQSTAASPEKKRYAFEAGAKAIAAHCKRCSLGKVKVKPNKVPGTYRVCYPLQGEPKVSVIIPNKDHEEDLRTCIHSVFQENSYENTEVIIVENNSTKESVFRCYRELEEQYENLKVVVWEGRGFNFSAINNFAVSQAAGEYLLFLNNDTEMIHPDCIKELLSFCQRPEVGIVGAQLFYGDDTIQHAGVVVGYKGIAGHTFVGFHKEEKTYFLRSMCAQDYSAVTAACLMTRRDVFEAVGGFDESLAVAFNDIDYCLKVREMGRLVVYNPFAQLYHYESKSRGQEDTPEKALRFDREVELFRKRWEAFLKAGDPYYNPNLTLLASDFSLRDFDKEPLETGIL